MLREMRGQVLRQYHEEKQVLGQQVRTKMRAESRSQMHAKVRTKELMTAAVSRLLETYADLAQRRSHLFADLLGGQVPRQWRHYPEDDAIDPVGGFQWFYHAHAPQDRPAACEHGHIHLFARRKLWTRRLRSMREIAFARLSGEPPASHNPRHLLSIGFDAKGVPTTIFTVNSWVTGDRMLSAPLTADILQHMTLDTGNEAVDAVIGSLVRLYREEIDGLLCQRDQALFAWPGDQVLSDQRLELLSELRIDVDRKLRAI